MKKSFVAVAGVMLAGSLAMFAGCGASGSVGVIEGNYTPTTYEELSVAIGELDLGKSFGDPTAEDWKFGLAVEGKLNFNMESKASYNGQSESSKSKLSANVNYKLSMDKSSMAGMGDFSMTASGLSEGGSTQSVKASAYNDSSYVYASATEDGETTKVKMSIEDMFDMIGDEIPVLPTDIFSFEDFDVEVLIDMMEEVGATVSMDQNSGLKIKFSFGENILDEISGEFLTSGLEFTTSIFDIYVAFDEDGSFNKIGLDVNFVGNMSASYGVMSMSTKMTISGGLSIQKYTGTVTLPDGIANDESYVDFGRIDY